MKFKEMLVKWISLQLPDQVVQLVHHIGELTGHGVVLCLSGLVLKKAGEDCGETGLKQRTAGGLGDVGGSWMRQWRAICQEDRERQEFWRLVMADWSNCSAVCPVASTRLRCAEAYIPNALGWR